MTTSEGSIQAARIEAAARAILDDNPFNDEPNLWEVPSIRAHYTAIGTAALAAADAAGPSKPRTITTMDELDALPASSVVLDAEELPLERFNNGIRSAWTYGYETVTPQLPATVLHEPEAEVAG